MTMNRNQPDWIRHDLGNGLSFLVGQLPDELLWDDNRFAEEWKRHPTERHLVKMFNKVVETPRFQQASGANYSYTGSRNNALPVSNSLAPLLHWVRDRVDPRMNGLLTNWYEGAASYIGPHHDSTKGLVIGAPIVTVSFGETRMFRLTPGKDSDQPVRDFAAVPGTVFVLPYDTNQVWKHSVPKRASYAGRRISVTFRAFDQGVLPIEQYWESASASSHLDAVRAVSAPCQ